MNPHVALEFLPEAFALGIACIVLGFAAIAWRARR
jgi:hypothetical protein